MTRLSVALSLFAVLVLSAQADGPDEVSGIDVCRDLSLVAKNVMTARQEKRPMSEVLPDAIKQMEDWAKKYGIEMDSINLEEAAAALVIPAYDMGAYPSSSSWNPERKDAIRDFENEIFEDCYEEWMSE
jgi:hypothetical protein